MCAERRNESAGRAAAICIFFAVFFFFSAIVGPGIVLLFDIAVADPVTAGWPLASALFVVAGISTAMVTAGYGLGVLRLDRRYVLDRRKLREAAGVFAVVALGGVPLIAVFLGALMIAGSGGVASNCALMLRPEVWCIMSVIVLLGYILGRISLRYSRSDKTASSSAFPAVMDEGGGAQSEQKAVETRRTES
jgi:hypothetical protein